MRTPPIALAGLLFLGLGCAAPKELRWTPEARFFVLDSSVPADSALQLLLAPYKRIYDSATGLVIGYAPQTLMRGQPEGPLGNFVADLMLQWAQERWGGRVRVALTNNGGLRAPLFAGPITVGAIYELMPFENTMTRLELTGEQLMRLADRLAEQGGQPISGMSFRIRERRAEEVRVQGEAVRPEGRYGLVTTNFVADGGDGILSPVGAPLEREDTTTLLRELILAHIRTLTAQGRHVEARIDGRIRREQ
ncbi:MAG: 5'-nucleotidase C-terminal domain-containing protein [Bacteroidetes bacterium]|nr:5'-nucleotidase C-terminal domain-containing protein [Rhodothermia bacterium]MCX7907397.1 5'-nucleotidase C-terminal domain-containing protein [Bacteroidota bacterium]MDW8284672.1 5'-nucleotidase [Bacteroidota bacterium]